MKCFITIFMISLSHMALSDEGIHLQMIDGHTLGFKVTRHSLHFNEKHGVHLGQTFKVPRSDLIRSGCSVRSEWIQTVGSNMSLEVYPQFKLRWWGTLGPQSGPSVGLLEVRIYTKNMDGKPAIQNRYYMDTTDIDLNWVSVEENYGDTYYHGRLNNRFKSLRQTLSSPKRLSFGPASVDGFGEFQVAICNVQRQVEVSLDGLFIVADFEE